MDDNRLLWNAVFAADMVASFRETASLRGGGKALELIPHTIEDAECLADEIVLEYNKYKLKKGR